MSKQPTDTIYEEKGHKIPENPKARKKSVNYLFEKIEQLKKEHATYKVGYEHNLEEIEKLKEQNEGYKATIKKFKARKDELEAQIKELQEVQYDYDELSELKSQKAVLEKQVSELHEAKKQLEQAQALLEDIALDDTDEI